MKPTKDNSKRTRKFKKPIAVLLAVTIGLMVSGIIGMQFFDQDYTEDQKLTIEIQDRYPTQEELQAALDSGEFLESDLSNELKAWMYFQGTDFEFESPMP